MLKNVDRLLKDVPVPKMFIAKQKFARPYIAPEDIPQMVKEQIDKNSLGERIKPGMSIAITAGSRGIANIAIITKAIVDYVKEKGANPFIVPAMGSHGGANAEGQKELLSSFGITAESMGCPLKASMEVVQLGISDRGKKVYLDKYASEADGIIVSCRVKPHNSYRYKYESGILKMMAVGLGKQAGAAQCHEDGVPSLPLNIESIAKVILQKAPVLFAVATIENAFDETAKIQAVAKEEILDVEPGLLEEAKGNMPSILVGKADVLVIDEIGKNYSGSGTDPNITGTFSTDCASGGLQVQRTCMLDVSEESHGNAFGTGLSNAITRRLFNKMDFDKMYPNCITSTVLKTAMIPVVMDSDLRAIQICIQTCCGVDKEHIRMARIKNSLHIGEIMLSEAYYDEVKQREDMEILTAPFELKFDEEGTLSREQWNWYKRQIMNNMKLIIRWHGENDPVSLEQYAQIPNLYGIVTSLYHMPLGEEWDKHEIEKLKNQIEQYELKFEIVDSFRIHEDIKRGYDTRDELIENYKKNIRMLADCGIKIICYNFMPVFDWTRTDLAYMLPDGSDCLSFEVAKVEAIDPERGIDLPGWGTNHTPEQLQKLLKSYENIDEKKLWENCHYFLRKVLPTAQECGIKLALHPDDPPRNIFGLPRIAKNVEDYRRIINTSDIASESNCITFCCGSFGSVQENDLPSMIREFGPVGKIPFVHFRNIQRSDNGDFYESGHQTGCGSNDMWKIMEALYDMDQPFYLRPDHGRRIWNEAWRTKEIMLPDGTVKKEHRPDGWNGVKPVAGYGIFDRALGAAYAQGLYEGIARTKNKRRV